MDEAGEFPTKTLGPPSVAVEKFVDSLEGSCLHYMDLSDFFGERKFKISEKMP